MAEREISENSMVRDFPIPARVKNALIDAGWVTVDDLRQLSLDDLKVLDGVGAKGLTELREYVYGKYKIVFKKKPKPKKTQDFKGAQAVVQHLLGNNVEDWGRQIRAADQLIKKYSVATLLLVKPKEKVYSLVWYLGEPYGHDYISRFIPGRVITEEKKEEEECAPVEFKGEVGRPKTLKEFLNL